MAPKLSEEEIKKKIDRLIDALVPVSYKSDGVKGGVSMDMPGLNAWVGLHDEDDADSTDDCGADERDYPGEARKQHFCEHEYVNVSFTGLKMVCKLCDKVKE